MGTVVKSLKNTCRRMKVKNKQLEAVKTFCAAALLSLDRLAESPEYQTAIRKAFLEGSKAALDGVAAALKDIEEKGQ